MIIRKCPYGEFPPENSRPIKLLPGKVPPGKLLPQNSHLDYSHHFINCLP